MRIIVAIVLAITLVAPPAAAAEPRVVTARPLPTWQTNGIVWTIEYAGGVTYVGGNFTAVRPPGAAPGQREVRRKNLAAFDAATGALLPFQHRFTSPTQRFERGTNPDVTCGVSWQARTYTCDTVYDIRRSPDGSRIYVAGDFQSVDGISRRRLAAFDIRQAKAPLDKAFRPGGPNYRVLALAVTGSTVYAGGLFSTASGQSRARLAAFRRSDGALTPWAPRADGTVMTMAPAPDASRILVGGEFSTVNGVAIQGLAPIGAASGALTRWDTRPIPKNVRVTDLTMDRDTVYVAAEGQGSWEFDGRLAADPYTGAVRWKDECLGATWAVAVIGDTLYSGSHAHNCSPVGGFGEQHGTRYFRLLAETARSPKPELRHWFPSTNGGDPRLAADRTPARLGPRALAATGSSLWVGGQFTTVNDVPQQGLTRFGFRPHRSMAPVRPARPEIETGTDGAATIRWRITEDLDDARLVYVLYRDGTPIRTVTAFTPPWYRPRLAFTDRSARPGAAYTVVATDPDGNTSPRSPAARF